MHERDLRAGPEVERRASSPFNPLGTKHVTVELGVPSLELLAAMSTATVGFTRSIAIVSEPDTPGLSAASL